MIGLALAAALAGPAIVESCAWDRPGSDPYTGTSQAAIMAMPLPLDVRQRLAARPLDSYDHFVVVDRDSIRTSGAEFAPDISFLNFGTGKRVCAGVDRRSWKPDHVETALVLCDAVSGWCVGKFAVCSNWAIFTRQSALGLLPPAILPPVAMVESVPPILTTALPAAPGAVLAPIPTTFEGYGPGFIGGGFYGGGGYYGGGGGGGGYVGGGGYCVTCAPVCPPDVPISPVPEPETWAMLIAGIGALTWRRKCK